MEGFFIKKRTHLIPIRTASLITAKIIIEPIVTIALYKRFATRAKELHVLGLGYRRIAKALNVSVKTAKLACKFTTAPNKQLY